MEAFDIEVYPESFIICDKKYGYDYLYLSFLEVADTLTDEDMYEIVTRVAETLKNYMGERKQDDR